MVNFSVIDTEEINQNILKMLIVKIYTHIFALLIKKLKDVTSRKKLLMLKKIY